MEQVETCPNLTQLEEWGNTKQRLSVLPRPQHQGAGHQRAVSSRQGRGLPRVTRHACGRSSVAPPRTPGCLLLGRYLLSTGCVQGTVVLWLALCSFVSCCALCPTCLFCLFPLIIITSFSKTADITLLGAFPEPLSPGAQPWFRAPSRSSRAPYGCLS